MFFKLPDWLVYEIQQRWERLAVRQWINNNPNIIIGITCASALLFLVVVIAQLTSGQAIKKLEDYEKAWFYDLNTGELFIARSNAAAPIEAPSGLLPNGEPAGVKAYVFSYTYEPNESERFIGFLEIADPNAEKDSSGSAQQWGQGKFIRMVDDEQWVPGNSSEGRAILREVFTPNANGETASYCPPE